MYSLPDSRWFFAELIEEIAVEGFPRNVVHRNENLIYANSAEEAYAKALALAEETTASSQKFDPSLVRTRFWRLGDLNDRAGVLSSY